MLEIPAAVIKHATAEEVTFEIPRDFREAWLAEAGRIKKKKIWQAYVKIGSPLKPRSTGKRSDNRPGSQNTHIHGHATQIGQETGETKSKIIADAVEIAVSMYPDFRMRKDYIRRIVPVTESEPWSTGEAAAVIEALHQIASFCDVKLREYEEE